jgi:hypothetical protein
LKIAGAAAHVDDRLRWIALSQANCAESSHAVRSRPVRGGFAEGNHGEPSEFIIEKAFVKK